jgi:osmotically-inducible protein OsmY
MAGIAACSTMPGKAPEQQATDRATAEAVRDALSADKLIYARHVTVQVDDGVVRLGGYVWNDHDLYQAQQIAATVPGVTRVVDEMELERDDIGSNANSR